MLVSELDDLLKIAKEIQKKKNKILTPELVRQFISKNDNFVLWGAGQSGLRAKKNIEYSNKFIDFFVDNDTQKKNITLDGISVMHPSDIDKFENKKIIICSQEWHSINKQLNTQYHLKFLKDFIVEPYIVECTINFQNYFIENYMKFLQVFDLLNDEESKKIYYNILKYRLCYNMLDVQATDSIVTLSNYEQYFHPSVKPEYMDIIVDGGAFTGDTIIEIIKQKIDFSIIYSFEPNNVNFKKLLKIAERTEKVYPVNAGLWSNNTKLNFIQNGPSSKITELKIEDSNHAIEVNSLDNFFLNKEKPTIIKMDIEGSEKKALLGAQNLIMKYMPKLQICIYHKPEDLCDIPLMIKKWVPDYSLYLGHHSTNFSESVLYAKV